MGHSPLFVVHDGGVVAEPDPQQHETVPDVVAVADEVKLARPEPFREPERVDGQSSQVGYPHQKIEGKTLKDGYGITTWRVIYTFKG